MITQQKTGFAVVAVRPFRQLWLGVLLIATFAGHTKIEMTVNPMACVDHTLTTIKETVLAGLVVAAGQMPAYHVYAKGDQIYVATQTTAGVNTWVLKAPQTTLYADSCYQTMVGTHYDGPTWESTDGSNVTA